MSKQVKRTENKTSESLLRRSFEPLLSPKDSKARLTFVGYQHSILEWKKDGKQITQPVLKLVFSVLDVTHNNPATIAITCNYRYNPNNRLGTTLNLMGFEVVETKTVVDEDDEYGVKIDEIDSEKLFDFLTNKAGTCYKALMQTATRKDKFTGERKEAKGLWEIDYTSIEPLMGKDGKQKRDVSKDDLGELITAPKIDYEGESD